MHYLGPLQLPIMNIIWDKGNCTVHDVHDVLNTRPDCPELAYTTVLTVMRNLARQRFLKQGPGKFNRGHLFRVNITAEDYISAVLQDVCNSYFKGDMNAMIKMAKGMK